jgi:hypothetical protein
VDNTGGCQLYLSKESLEASITTAKSSEINVLVPGAEPNGDWVCFLVSLFFLSSIVVSDFLNAFLVILLLFCPLLPSLCLMTVFKVFEVVFMVLDLLLQLLVQNIILFTFDYAVIVSF